jgi:hypothetical protein
VKIKSPNMTSGQYLIELLRDNADLDADHRTKYELGFDVYIKQRSYAILNKALFFTSVLATIGVAAWPIIVQFPPVKATVALVSATVVQTVITGFAGFNVYAYHHYKNRQVAAENILRLIAFSSTPLDRLVKTVREEMTRLDQGIAFRLKAEGADDPG